MMSYKQIMLDFSQSLDMDWQLAEWDITGSVAHAKMLCKIGILTQRELSEIERGLGEILNEIKSGAFVPKIELEDVHMNIEARLTEKIGASGAKLHTGRSRNDQIATTMRLFLRSQYEALDTQMHALLDALKERAAAHASVIVPGYTHLQQAQPITMGHYWNAHYEAFSRDLKRLAFAHESIGECPLGAGALAGSTLPLDREYVSQLLGFERPTANSLDTVASRDHFADYHHFASVFAVHVSRLAEDFVIYSSQEFGWLVLDDAFCTGSSMMPQKRNPDAAELLRGKTGQIFGHALDLLVILKGTPMSYDRDFQEDKRGLFASIKTVKQMLTVLTALISSAKVKAQRALDSLRNGYTLATDLAEDLVLKGVPFREAHGKVAKLVNSGEDIFERMSLEASVGKRGLVSSSPSPLPASRAVPPPGGGLKLVGYFDGASKGNPGRAGAGACIYEGDAVVWESAVGLGVRTNNEAEYAALINLLSELARRGVKEAVVRGDSKLVIEQMSGRWKVKEPRLKILHDEAAEISKHLKVKYEWVPREKNTHADRLSNEGI